MGALLKQYTWALNLLFVLLLSYFLAKITNVYIAKVLEVPQSIGVVSSAGQTSPIVTPHDVSDYEVIVSRNIFDSSETPVGDGATTGDAEMMTANPTGEAVKTALAIKVVAVMVIGDGKDKRSTATVDSNGVDVYAVADDKKAFAPGVRLVQVKPTRIEFIHGQRLEYAELDERLGESIFGLPKEPVAKASPARSAPPGEKIAKLGENKFVIDQAEIDGALSNLERLYTEIRAVPNFQDGKVVGMKILSIKPGSLFAKLGLKRGDVMARINGVDIDIKRGFEIFNQLKDQKAFNLDLQRDGKNQTLDYEIR